MLELRKLYANTFRDENVNTPNNNFNIKIFLRKYMRICA